MCSSSRSRVFLTKYWFSIGSRAHVMLTCWKPGRIVRKPANGSPGLKFIWIITFSSIQMFFAALFWVYGDYKPQNSKSNSKQKPHPKVTKLKSTFYLSANSAKELYISLNLSRIQIPTGTSVTNCNHKHGPMSTCRMMSTCSRENALFYPYRKLLI